MHSDVVFFTVASGPYEIFALPYALTVLRSNPNAAVEIVVDHLDGFRRRYGAGWDILREHFQGRSLLLREEKHEFGAHKARFLLTPETYTRYVYIGDVDILLFDSDIVATHLEMMRAANLPWSNQERRGTSRLTGLHFTQRDAYYPVADVGPMVKRRLSDEELLYELVRTKTGMPTVFAAARPLHGIHMSLNRLTDILPTKSVPNWGVTTAYWQAYKSLKSSDVWKAVSPHLAPEYCDLLHMMERVCAPHYDGAEQDTAKEPMPVEPGPPTTCAALPDLKLTASSPAGAGRLASNEPARPRPAVSIGNTMSVGESNAFITTVHLALLKGKTWRYLRYLHLREYVARIANEIGTVCVCGAGHGLAELAIAVEFPHLQFTLTDIIATGYPNYHQTMARAWKGGVTNLHFSIWNVLEPPRSRFDLVCSTEMLEHIPAAEKAAANMRTAATRYIYCLVPFSDSETNKDPKRIAQAARHEHCVYGFEAERMEKLFPGPVAMAGTYWSDAGHLFRQRLTAMSDAEIETNASALIEEARADLRDAIPTHAREAAGIKILSRVG